MPLPTRTDVLTLGFTGAGQPAAYIEAKALSPSSATLGYTLQAQPVFGLPTGVVNVTLLPSLFTNTNQFFTATISPGTATLSPELLVNPNLFFVAAIRGGSPVPIPFHPFCERGSLTVDEAARGDMVVSEYPRGSLSVDEAARGDMTVPEFPRNTMTTQTAPRKSLNPGC